MKTEAYTEKKFKDTIRVMIYNIMIIITIIMLTHADS